MRTRSLGKTYLVLLLILVLVSCCKPDNEIAFLNDNSCNPPCWMRIEPGKSTAEEALNILKYSDLIDEPSIERILAKQYYPPDQIFFRFKGDGSGNLSITNEIISSIRVHKVELPISLAYEKYGIPDQLMILRYWEWEGKWYVTLLYPEKGIILRYIKKEMGLKENTILIEPNDIVSEIRFTFPDNMKSLIESIIFGGPEEKTFDYQSIVQEYRGYGEVKIIRP